MQQHVLNHLIDRRTNLEVICRQVLDPRVYTGDEYLMG